LVEVKGFLADVAGGENVGCSGVEGVEYSKVMAAGN
jgi:hypothetical protein